MTHKLPLTVKNLHFSYGQKEVLRGISGDFYEGTFYSIAGPNGSGKTTWLKALAGLNQVLEATVTLFGKDLRCLNNQQVATRLSYVPQMFNIQYAFTVEEVVAMGRYPYIGRFGNPTKEDRSHVEIAISETNLEGLRKRCVNELSGGELQRVVIARAIAQNTEIIILDEPISHLDIRYQHEIVVLLKRLCREKNKTVITVLHDLNVTLNHSDHIFLMKDGRIITQGEPHKVLTEGAVEEVYGLEVDLLDNGEGKWLTW